MIGICRYFIVPDDSNTFGKSGVTFNIYFMLYFWSAFKSSLCDALPKNSPGTISTGASICCGYTNPSQSDGSLDPPLLHNCESEYGVEIRSDLQPKITKFFRHFD